MSKVRAQSHYLAARVVVLVEVIRKDQTRRILIVFLLGREEQPRQRVGSRQELGHCRGLRGCVGQKVILHRSSTSGKRSTSFSRSPVGPRWVCNAAENWV